MKTAKPPNTAAPAMEASSSRRSQPVRQTRTNPARSSGGPGRALARDALNSGPNPEQPIPIFPGITHFADAISALPKEVVKHFTLLKEVDSKLHSPEKNLFALVQRALDTSNLTDPSQEANGVLDPPGNASASASAQNDANGAAMNGAVPAMPSTPHLADIHKLSRPELFQHLGAEAREMLVALEEKCHVITVANEALNKQLMRIEEIWPHLCEEFSDEAKWGSTTHWAYPENRAGRANNAQAERTRREGAASLSAAAQQIAEEHAARSDARKQAVAAKKSSKNQIQESDFDDVDGKNKTEPTKKSSGKSRKPAAGGESPATVGLGISNAGATNGNPAPKRRKVDKTAAGTAPPERAMASVFGTNGVKPKANSPGETPAPEAPTKKRKALPTSANQAKKSRNGPGPPSVTSSPVIGAFPDPSKPGRSSPAPSAAPRPASSRARQNSTHSAMENGRQRAPSAASIKPNGVSVVLPELAPQSNGGRPHMEKNKESSMPARPETAQPDAEPTPPVSTPSTAAQKKEPVPKPDAAEPKKEPTPTISVPTPITTKSGRASKPSTPALATFAEAATARSRPSRAGETTAAGGATTTAKRSHKKGASSIATITQKEITAINNAAKASGSDSGSNGGAKRKADDDDPRYCTCNQPSFGEMVACDADDCEKEWFHYACVGLKSAPPAHLKWYCNDCRERLKIGSRKSAGR